MPLISSKGIYGISAMQELYMHKEETPMQIKDIALKTNIPQNYLEQLLNKLKKAKLVQSTRGSKGGYRLSKDGGEILVKDILIVLENGIKLNDVKSSNVGLNIFLAESRDKIENMFDISLKDLEEYESKYSEYLHYNI